MKKKNMKPLEFTLVRPRKAIKIGRKMCRASMVPGFIVENLVSQLVDDGKELEAADLAFLTGRAAFAAGYVQACEELRLGQIMNRDTLHVLHLANSNDLTVKDLVFWRNELQDIPLEHFKMWLRGEVSISLDELQCGIWPKPEGEECK